ncbi:MAG: hypothetical protein JWN63_565 [Candidatus Acidoferrum typicum]|nr:hypothetical protein [Candidatus Acidoferrum typicum]
MLIVFSVRPKADDRTRRELKTSKQSLLCVLQRGYATPRKLFRLLSLDMKIGHGAKCMFVLRHATV